MILVFDAGGTSIKYGVAHEQGTFYKKGAFDTPKTGLPVSMANDAKCAAMGELWKGIARDYKNVVFIICGTGIGGAIIEHGKLYTGVTMNRGEFGNFQYNNIPWYISENGMGVQDEEQYLGENGMVMDDYRIEFIREHLKYLHKAISEGCNCFGYHLWSPFDCWSWTNAYKNRYGLLRVDIYDKCRITMKKSGLWFQELSKQNGF